MIKRFFKSLDWQLTNELPLLLLLLIMVTLRIPNFFEPYWYGDEGIYLTLGVAMRQGAILYQGIIDHKTPLIYYLAMVPTQVHFRVLLTFFMLTATSSYYFIAHKLLKSLKLTFLTTLVFILLTTLPWFEGNIPNGELFVMTFVLAGGVLLFHTDFYKSFFKSQDQLTSSQKYKHPIQQTISFFLSHTKDNILLFVAGFLFGLGVLTKVPGIFDALSFFTIAYFVVIKKIFADKLSFNKILAAFLPALTSSLIILAGLITPIFISIIYFTSRGAISDYLDYGLLYNFRYIKSWGLPFDSEVLIFLFSMFGKMLVVIMGILTLTIFHKKLKPEFLFVGAWTLITMFAALLSNRPYPHYFIQVIPSLVMLAALVLQKIYQSIKGVRLSLTDLLVSSIFGLSVLTMFVYILILLNVGLYPTQKYYVNSFKYLTGQMSPVEYYLSFDRLMEDNYNAAEIIVKSDDPHMFIWGTNPMLYALAEKSPPGRFIVSFHIKDFDAYDETMQAVRDNKPHFIVIMNDEQTPLPGLNEYLENYYILNSNFSNFSLYMRLDKKYAINDANFF